jgi:antitoxin (DNA-binding transcriptional repressor) of toxin-antitoxin stability system
MRTVMQTVTSKSCQVDTMTSGPYFRPMPAEKTMTVGEFKAHFSAALDAVLAGQTVVVAFGRNRRKVAAMVPYASLEKKRPRKLGILEGKVKVVFSRGFKMTDDELLSA